MGLIVFSHWFFLSLLATSLHFFYTLKYYDENQETPPLTVFDFLLTFYVRAVIAIKNK